MNYFRNYSQAPTQPFALPISSHPAAVPCSPGAKLADGSFVSRGGVFEGPAMAEGESHCGYWSDNVGDVNLWQQGYPASRPGPNYAMRVVQSWPPETPARFQPREINLGYPISPMANPYAYEAASMSGFGQVKPQIRRVPGRKMSWYPKPQQPIPPPCNQNAQVTTCNVAGCTNPQCSCQAPCFTKNVVGPIGPGKVGIVGTVCECPAPGGYGGFGAEPQHLDPMYLLANRQRNIWTAPQYDTQAQYPPDMTPRGGVLDGNTVQYRGQGASSAYYYGESPKVLQPVDMVDVLPNPLDQEPVPVVGWGVSGLGDYYTPGSNGGAQEAQLPKPICPSIATSIFEGAVPGGKVLAKSIFETNVYETRRGDVPARVTINPASDAVPAYSSSRAMQLPCSGFGACGAGPDGLGFNPEPEPPARLQRFAQRIRRR